MGRGLSQQQRQILDALPWLSAVEHSRENLAPSVREIMRLIGVERTPSNRASVSRAVSRLRKRGLVLSRWGFRRGYQHCGSVRVTPEQFDEWETKRRAFLAQWEVTYEA